MVEKMDIVAPNDMGPTPQDVSNMLESLRPIRKRSRIGAIILASTVAIGSVLPADIAFGKASIADSFPILHPIADPLDKQADDNIPVIYIDGFARQDSSWQARNMQEAIQENTGGSSIDALEYSEKGINIQRIAETIAQHIESEGASSVSLYGYSVGGEASLLVAGVLIHTYGIRVERIYLDHSPADAKSIRPEQREMGANVLNTLEFFEGMGLELQYSSIARQIVNNTISEDLTYINQVSSSLIIDQYSLGASTNTQEAIAALRSDTEPLPVLVYVSSSDSNSDQVIDLDRSEDMFRKEANANNIPFVSLTVDGGLHGRPDLIIDSYNETFTQSKPVIDKAVDDAEILYRLQHGTDIHMRVFLHH
jgi:hypothetical protein